MGNATAVPTTPSNCRIVIVAPNNGEESLSELRYLPSEAVILGTGNNLEELQKNCPLFTEVC